MGNIKSFVEFACIVFILFLSACAGRDSLVVYDLKCENLQNPLGIDKTTPRFSWKIRSDKNGTEQKAFQVMVASNADLLDKNQADLWDSGKTESSASILVPFGGKSLNSGLVYYWKVRMWDETGNISSWSPIAEFSIGLLNKDDWQALYIGFPTESGYNECPQLKKSFNLDETGKQMLLHVNSLGYHEVYLNGKKVGDGVLSSAVSQFDKRSWAITYDVSSLLKKGQNDLVLWLGSGWYTEGLPGVVSNGPLVKAQMERLSENKRETILATDTSWAGRKSGYTRHGNWRPHNFGGEIIDGSLAQTDLSMENTTDRSWNPVSVISVPDHEVSPQMVEQNRITETIKPTEIQPLGKDTFLIDMGKSLTGWTEIHFPKLQKAQEIVLEYSDHLDENGKFVNQKQMDRYIASGEETEIFKNKFNYHGYRYIRISNLAKTPDRESITAYLVHTGYELAAGFQCSDPELNQIHDMILYTLRCLSIGGDLVDCPQIERLGYGGDGNASTETAQTMFNLNPLYANWLQAWADCIRDDGGMPHTAPNPYAAGGGPYWCGFIITASWRTYMNYGDAAILEKYYPVMQKWLGYVDKYTVDGLLKRWPDNDYRGWYLGDWATPKGIDQTAEASVDLVNNCFVAVCYDNMQRIAQVLGKTDDIERYARKKSELQKQIHQNYFDSTKNSYATGTQIDLAYPMLAGVVPEKLTGAITQSLINETENNRNGHFACGLVGIPVLTEWAVKNQAAELMYSMLKKKDYPGYLYMIENGATTTWEHWNGERSRIHNCYNGIGSWFYQALGGIRLAENVPAYQKVLIQPQIPQSITWAKTFKETPYGKLVVNWDLKGKTMELYVEIPVGVEAGIAIPSGVKKYRLDSREIELSGEKNAVVELKSGKYKIDYTL
ncbi:MAG: alpha-rhamnosidase [Bacteroidetes bacterium GWF2_42_66]|nr:MAG: alpha-rhamnosidase [Bacteroidetes bacterium GWA2_42_15]OFY01366.1 MAG: alpha-rhamnosidase [Bacteroidetes bacterium GWE2_42_39]OFY42210.1 MAG: alpha-rhamnosidase [Bacteroidetes bacterium GWF2_42_66]